MFAARCAICSFLNLALAGSGAAGMRERFIWLVFVIFCASNGAATLTSSLNPAYFQHSSVTFTANVAAVSSATLPSGTVTFFDGLASLATVPLDAAGQAKLQISNLEIGTHSITAIYNGGGGLTSSSSPPLIQRRSPAPRPALSCSKR